MDNLPLNWEGHTYKFVLSNSGDRFINTHENTISSFDLKGNLQWTLIDEKFCEITSIQETNEFIVIGGCSKKVGYLGYVNPYVIVIQKSTGKKVSEYAVSQKNSSITDIQLSDDFLFIGLGYFPVNGNLRESENTSIKAYLIKDKLNEKGQFVNNLFN